MRPSTATAFIDAIFIITFALLVALWLIIRHINPPENDGQPPPGELIAEIHWPDSLDADVDLWARAPGERPVGYANRAGITYNLLRDDLGHPNDYDPRNFEHIISRGLPDGEHIFNVHLYGNKTNQYPVPVKWEVYLSTKGRKIVIGQGTVQLFTRGQEITLIVFSLSAEQIVPNSIHNAQIPIRAAS